MQLVGAPLSYIRGPFVMEGTILGVVGAAIATLALWGRLPPGGDRWPRRPPASSTRVPWRSCPRGRRGLGSGRRGDRMPRRSLGGPRGALTEPAVRAGLSNALTLDRGALDWTYGFQGEASGPLCCFQISDAPID